MKLAPYLSPCTNISSQWIKDLDVSSETLKLLKERIGNTKLISIVNNFLNRTPIAQQ
jgi:hypothetical protein